MAIDLLLQIHWYLNRVFSRALNWGGHYLLFHRFSSYFFFNNHFLCVWVWYVRVLDRFKTEILRLFCFIYHDNTHTQCDWNETNWFISKYMDRSFVWGLDLEMVLVAWPFAFDKHKVVWLCLGFEIRFLRDLLGFILSDVSFLIHIFSCFIFNLSLRWIIHILLHK